MHDWAILEEAARSLCPAAPSGATESLILIKLCVLLLRVLMGPTPLETARLKVGQKLWIRIILSTLGLLANDLEIEQSSGKSDKFREKSL